MRCRARPRGFTLIELLTVLAAVAILAAIAYPSYREQVRRAHRASAQSFLLDVSLRQQQRLVDVRAYAASLDELRMAVPGEVAPHYAVELVADPGPPGTFTVTATPSGAQAGDSCGPLRIDSRGVKTPSNCW
jgi:type IV pilus assembly protein PilE